MTASLTAYVVAATVAGLGAQPRWRGLLDEDAVAIAAACVRHAADGPVKRLVSRAPTALLVGFLEHAFVPGMAWHYLFRKHWIEEEVRRGIAGGAAQLLVLGGGFDSLGMRIARAFPRLPVFEVDRPVTQGRKRAVLLEAGIAVPPNFAFVAEDLAERPLDEVLPGIRPELSTIVVIEGVLMYLEEPAVRGLFGALHRLFRGELIVLFGATAGPDTAASWRIRLVNRVLTGQGEGTSWSCPMQRMPDFLSPLGFAVEDTISYRGLQAPHRSEAELRRVPAEDENYYRVRREG